MDAPAIQLDGPFNVVGTEHYYATIAQRRNGGVEYMVQNEGLHICR